MPPWPHGYLPAFFSRVRVAVRGCDRDRVELRVKLTDRVLVRVCVGEPVSDLVDDDVCVCVRVELRDLVAVRVSDGDAAATLAKGNPKARKVGTAWGQRDQSQAGSKYTGR